jgi:hypothetical protein
MTQPLTEMITRNLPGCKGGWHIKLTASLSSVSRLSRECASLFIAGLIENSQRNCEIYPTLLPICTVAEAVKAMAVLQKNFWM